MPAKIFVLQEVTEESSYNIHFIKLHAPWPLLCKYAEELNLRAPLQVDNKISKVTNSRGKYSLFIKMIPFWKLIFSFFIHTFLDFYCPSFPTNSTTI